MTVLDSSSFLAVACSGPSGVAGRGRLGRLSPVSPRAIFVDGSFGLGDWLGISIFRRFISSCPIAPANLFSKTFCETCRKVKIFTLSFSRLQASRSFFSSRNSITNSQCVVMVSVSVLSGKSFAKCRSGLGTSSGSARRAASIMFVNDFLKRGGWAKYRVNGSIDEKACFAEQSLVAPWDGGGSMGSVLSFASHIEESVFDVGTLVVLWFLRCGDLSIDYDSS